MRRTHILLLIYGGKRKNAILRACVHRKLSGTLYNNIIVCIRGANNKWVNARTGGECAHQKVYAAASHFLHALLLQIFVNDLLESDAAASSASTRDRTRARMHTQYLITIWKETNDREKKIRYPFK